MSVNLTVQDRQTPDDFQCQNRKELFLFVLSKMILMKLEKYFSMNIQYRADALGEYINNVFFVP